MTKTVQHPITQNFCLQVIVRILFFLDTFCLSVVIPRTNSRLRNIIIENPRQVWKQLSWSPKFNCVVGRRKLDFSLPPHLEGLEFWPPLHSCQCGRCRSKPMYLPRDYRMQHKLGHIKLEFCRKLVIGPRVYFNFDQILEILAACHETLEEFQLLSSNTPPPLPATHLSRQNLQQRNDFPPFGKHLGWSWKQSRTWGNQFPMRKPLKRLKKVTVDEFTAICWLRILNDRYQGNEITEFHLHCSNQREKRLDMSHFDLQRFMPKLELLCCDQVISAWESYFETLYEREEIFWPRNGFKASHAFTNLWGMKTLKCVNLPNLAISWQRFRALEPILEDKFEQQRRFHMANHPLIYRMIPQHVKITFERRCGSTVRGELVVYQP